MTVSPGWDAVIINSGGVTSAATVVVAVVVVEVVVDVGGVVDVVEVVSASVVDTADVDVVVANPVVDVVVADGSTVPSESHAATATIKKRLRAPQKQRFIVNLGLIVAPWPHGVPTRTGLLDSCRGLVNGRPW